METLLEQQRRHHEERERVVDAMVREFVAKRSSHRDHVNSEQRTKMLLDRYMESTDNLKEMYEDRDNQRKEEIQSLSGPNEFLEFYNRLKGIKEFYRKHPNEVSVPMSVEFEEYTKMRESNAEEYLNLVEFKDEEGYGKYLDLHQHHEKYLNLKGIERVDYITYLGIFDRLYEIPKERKKFEYKKYIEFLLEYLYDYLTKIKPLTNFDDILTEVLKDFLPQWENGQFPGWPKGSTHSGALAQMGAHLDLSGFSNPQELASLGLDRLKTALIALELKCGGTLEERANRLFSTKGKSPDEIDPTLFVKTPGKQGAFSTKGKNTENEKKHHQEIAMIEAQIYRLAELLSEQRAATKENVTRKQARTAGENEESDDDEQASESDDDDDDDIPYNPKNLPLGWDGKPIPYWLYKLHGLNISYNCEICGNFTYKGPKAFQRHFAEWRHAHGMRCLGIPNTAHFANVTEIEDALQLWEKLKGEKTAERWHGDQEEEFEDSMGNVVNKKTFEDLKRQGLL